MKTILALVLLAANGCLGAIPAATVWEIRSTGSDTNGGGFDSTGSPSVDYSQNNNKNTSGCSNCGSSSVNLSTTDALITSASTSVTSATASFSSAMTGNLVYLSGGTCTTGSINTQWRRAAFSNLTTITLDVAPTGTFTGTCTGVTMNIGGALASPSIAATNKVAGNDVYIKSGTYTVSTTTTTASNGVVLDSTGGAGQNNNSIWWGYGATRGDDGAKPVLRASGIATVSMFKVTGSHVRVRNIELDGASLTAIKGFETTSNYLKLYRLKASNMPNRCYDLGGGSGTELRTAEGVNCGTMGVSLSSGNNAVNIEIHDGTGIGVSIGNQTVCDGCLVYRQTGATTDCFQASSIGAQIIRSVAAYCGRYGFNIAGNAGFSMIVTNSIAYGNATGFFGDQVQDGVSLYNNAGGNNSVANVTANDFPYNIGFVTLTADPFVSVSSSANGAANFALSTAAGGGALLRAAGLVGLAPSGNSTGYQDIGPMQHADPSGSGGQRSFTFLQ